MICGIPYRYTYSKQRTCGRTCGARLQVSQRLPSRRMPKPPPEPRPVKVNWCTQCGQPFVGPGRRYCSEVCAMLAKREYDRHYDRTQRTKSPTYGQCQTCGVACEPKRHKCDECIAKSRAERKRRERRRRRNLKRGAASEHYTLAGIAERDRFRCGLCRRRVAMTRVVPHPKAPTIDHIRPLADGGDDTRANVQLAHFECNWKKRDGGTQQLVLFG